MTVHSFLLYRSIGVRRGVDARMLLSVKWKGKEPVQSVMLVGLGVLALEVHAALILTEGPDFRAHVVNFSSFVFA